MNPLVITPVLAMIIVFTYSATPYVIRKMNQLGITGVDLHKPEKPTTAEMGGIVNLAALALATILLFALDNNTSILLGLLTIILVGLVGVADDLTAMRQRYKPFLVAAASLPLVIALSNTNGFTMPGLGPLDYGILFPIVIVPLGAATTSNLTNMLAGFNGLEIGTGSIALLSLTFLSAYDRNWAAATVGMLVLATLLPLLRYNWYPARIFPGDTGTLLVGGAIAAVALMANLEFAGIICLTPAIIDFALKITTRKPFGQRNRFGDTQVLADRTLDPPPYRALAHIFLRRCRLTEPELVMSMLIMQAVYAVGAIALALVFP